MQRSISSWWLNRLLIDSVESSFRRSLVFGRRYRSLHRKTCGHSFTFHSHTSSNQLAPFCLLHSSVSISHWRNSAGSIKLMKLTSAFFLFLVSLNCSWEEITSLLWKLRNPMSQKHYCISSLAEALILRSHCQDLYSIDWPKPAIWSLSSSAKSTSTNNSTQYSATRWYWDTS